MASRTTYNFKQLVANFTAAAQASSTKLLNFTVGSALLALAQAFSGIALWLQGLALSVLAETRAATSAGEDLDSWMADFNFFRYPGVAATGNVTFSRAVPGQQAIILVGVKVQTPDGTHVYTVVADTTNPNYSVPLGAYIIASNATSTTALVVSTSLDASGNVSANLITQITSTIPYVDNVTNLAAFTNGLDPESDASFRNRFPGYLQDLSKATKAALTYAISQSNTPAPTYFSLTENVDYTTGLAHLGYFFVIADDGTGAPSSPFLAKVSAAVEATRGFTIAYEVHGPGVVTANFTAAIVTAAGYNHSNVVATVTAALAATINSTNVGGTVSYSNLINACFTAQPGAVIGVNNALLNGSTLDISCNTKQVIRAGTIGIS